MELGGAPETEGEMEPSEEAQPHLEALDTEDAPRLGRGAGPQPRRGRTAEVNGRGRLRVSASSRDRRERTDFGPQAAYVKMSLYKRAIYTTIIFRPSKDNFFPPCRRRSERVRLHPIPD